MADPLSGPKSDALVRRRRGDLWMRELLAAGGEELRDVVDGVVRRAGIGAALRRVAPAVLRPLVLVFVGVVPAGTVVAGGQGPRHAPKSGALNNRRIWGG